MQNRAKRSLVGLPFLSVLVACSGAGPEQDATTARWAALLDDGVASTPTLALGGTPSGSASDRYCTDCATTPLAWWKLDFCNTQSTELEDSADSTPFPHPAFRAVSVACAAGHEGQAVRLAGDDDIIYSPDQPDYDFTQGLTIAAWLKPASVDRTQSLVRKRLDGTSAFALAIVNGRLEFILRLGNRRVAGIDAPIEAARFTHVAATYDGMQMRLYTDGTLVAHRDISGSIAAGDGPIFVGNDASGRQFKGLVDELWLNTLAAPPETIRGLNCVRTPPAVGITPSIGAAVAPNTPVIFDVSVTNGADPTFCPSDTFSLSPTLPYPLTTDNWYSEVEVGAGQTAHVTVNISATDSGSSGPITFYYSVYNQANYSLNATAQATFVVAAPPQ